jgi:hypothetical protein
MAQVFADDSHVGRPGMLVRPAQIPQQVGHGPVGPSWPEPPELGSTMTPGKGVRRIRCAGCSHDTLPRNSDGAPLCQRCSELLATAGARIDLFATSTIFRTPRWLRRRPTLG